MFGRTRWYVETPDGYRIYGRRQHWWSFVMRYPGSRIVRFLTVLPTLRINLHRPRDHMVFDPPDA